MVMATAAAATVTSSSLVATPVFFPRFPTTINTTRCSALPCLLPRLSSPSFQASLKGFSDAVENKSTVLLFGGGAIVAVWLSSVVFGAINSSVPLLPKILELVGLRYTGWFVYRYLPFKSSRKELATDIEDLKKKIAGTE